MSIGSSHRAAVRNETVVSTAINSLVPAAIIWLLELSPPRTLLGGDGIVKSMLPAAGLATLLMCLILTQLVRARVRKGQMPALDWPREERGLLRWLPNNLILRSIVLAILAIVLLVPTGLAVVSVFGILPLTRVGFLIFNLIFGASVGLVMTRFAVLPALADRNSKVAA